MRQEFTSTNTPQQNGVSERDGRTLTEMAPCVLSDGGFPKSLRRKAFLTAAFLVNRAPHKALRRKDANLKMLRTIGARAFEHVETYTPKLDPKPPRLGKEKNSADTARTAEPIGYTTQQRKG